MIASTAGTACSPWVRVPRCDEAYVKTALDAGYDPHTDRSVPDRPVLHASADERRASGGRSGRRLRSMRGHDGWRR